ncbi:hypothetical protein BSKO_07321 [Bryopsis sp. KO-2023]|nr:hypothetical protein BSKO_07321 [Bryopsis sp. KO-2023]
MQLSLPTNKCSFLNQTCFEKTQRQPFHHRRLKRVPPLRAVGMDDLTMDAQKLGVSFTPIHEDFGAEVSGMDLSGGISEAAGALVKDALDRFTLLRFRQQTLEPADEAKLLSFLPHDEERLLKKGESKNPFRTTIPGYPWLTVVPFHMDLDDYYGLTAKRTPVVPLFQSRLTWHMDLSNQPCPAMYSYMYMKIAPPKGIAGTLFASTVKAYSLLTDDQKKMAHKLRKRYYIKEASFKILVRPGAETALCESGVRFEDPTAIEEAAKNAIPDGCITDEHRVPFVIQEKGTGVRSINASPLKIHSFEGMTTEETHEFLEEVLGPQAATAPERVWTADWQAGDVVVWKNRHLIHSAPPRGSYDDPRLFHLVFWESNEPAIPVEDGP